jgi:hypothetical protein
MKGKFTFFSLFAAIIMAGAIFSNIIAQTVTVTMQINTSTCLDTLHSSGIVQVCGESMHATTPAITWDTTSGIVANNIGGDYWEATFQAQAGDTIKFKFVTFLNDFKHPTFHWNGWDGPINAGVSFDNGGNRVLIVGSNDTTLPLQYFNGWENTVAQYWRPFQDKQDSIAVYFRVNMGGVSGFDPASNIAQVYGSAPLGASPDWVKIIDLKQETNSVNQGSFWSGVAYIAKDSVTNGTAQSYKFVVDGSNWENTSDRSFTFSNNVINTMQDTTISWVYFNNMPPSGPQVSSTVNFRLRLDALEKAGLFNRGLGDRVGVTGAKGWPPSGFDFETDPAMLKMTFVPSIQEWVLSEPFTMFPGNQIIYKYYIAWDTSRVDTSSPNYIPGLNLSDGWEEPGVTGGGNRMYTFQNASDQTTPGDFGADQEFFNSLHPNSVITNPITLTFHVDMNPAANATTNPTNTLFRPGIDTAYIQFDGCLVPITQGKSMWGTDNRIMMNSPNSDGIYTASIDLTPPTFFQVCYRIVYTSPDGEVENGGGTNMGRRYYQYIVPTSVSGSTVTWPSSFDLAQVEWVQNNLTVENPPDLGAISGINDANSKLPHEYVLYQNYPNPFNPTTTITYALPKTSNVKIEIFNVLGQRIATLINQEQTAGTHSLEWNAMNSHNSNVTSGVYFLRMQAGTFTNVRKMMLMR